MRFAPTIDPGRTDYNPAVNFYLQKACTEKLCSSKQQSSDGKQTQIKMKNNEPAKEQTSSDSKPVSSPQKPVSKPSRRVRSYFNEADCGGVFDGFSVSSDADPGL